MNNLTFIIKTFLRPQCLVRLLESISIYYPNNPVIILDDSIVKSISNARLKMFNNEIHYIKTPYNIGLSKGRNMLLDLVSTKYFLLLDDDFILDKNSNIDLALQLLIDNNFDIIGGKVHDIRRNGEIKTRIFTGHLKVEDNTLFCQSLNIVSQDLYKVDFVLNFFIGNTNVVKEHKWNEDLKILEHLEFFYRLKTAGLNVYYYDKLECMHKPETNWLYSYYRTRSVNKYSQLLKEKLGVQHIVFNNETIKG